MPYNCSEGLACGIGGYIHFCSRSCAIGQQVIRAAGLVSQTLSTGFLGSRSNPLVCILRSKKWRGINNPLILPGRGEHVRDI